MKKCLSKVLKNSKKIIAVVLALAVICSTASLVSPSSEVAAEDKYPIMGPTNVTLGQLINYYSSNATYPAYYALAGTDAPTLDSFCQMYLDECNAEGVRVEVAFCQAMNETNYLKYTGRVPIEAKNFAGIGATDSTQEYNVFSSVREGIRAQVQHLKAYASTANLNNPCVDPRFHLVSRGCAPYLEDLSGRWASSPTYGTDIRNNFMAKLGTFNGFCTMYNGVEYSGVYDPYFYLDHYADVAALFAHDGYALLAHYVNHGMYEGRKACDWYDPYVYKANYVDLRNVFGHNIGAYTRHYLDFGEAEGRTGWIPTGSTDKVWVLNGVDYSAVYNYNFYTANNPDVTAVLGTDDIDVLTHFVNNGMSEGRQGSGGFDYKSYMNEYPDLRAEFRYNTRAYYDHYINYGVKEGRHGSGCNARVGAITRVWVFEMSDVYNYDYYLANNPDVAAAVGDDDIAALDHFFNNGMNEGRRASQNFDVWAYASHNPDLVEAFGMSLANYYFHYINYGRAEGRIAV
ncbi:MAG: glucosaminidase domain-containing protein [Lachnospiraceae bacterium]|nr:glucosaminidase domain-containing protein [Lachnospiraceae bacterium]